MATARDGSGRQRPMPGRSALVRTWATVSLPQRRQKMTIRAYSRPENGTSVQLWLEGPCKDTDRSWLEREMAPSSQGGRCCPQIKSTFMKRHCRPAAAELRLWWDGEKRIWCTSYFPNGCKDELFQFFCRIIRFLDTQLPFVCYGRLILLFSTVFDILITLPIGYMILYCAPMAEDRN